MFVKANNKSELIDETKLEIKKAFNVNVPTNLISRVVTDRSNTIKKYMELKVLRIIIGGIGSFVIKQGRNGLPRKLGREYYVRKNHKNDKYIHPKQLIKFKVVSNGEEF